MATFHVIGETLMKPDEILNKSISGDLINLTKNIKTLSKALQPSIAVGAAIGAEPTEDGIPTGVFEEIGIGKPLGIEIACVYAGKYKSFLGGRKDAVVVSGVRSTLTFQGTSRAVNIRSKNVDKNSYLNFTAFEDGTPIVYYSPAMDAESMVVSFEIMFDNFDTELLDTISGLLDSAVGIPVFMPAAAYLMGGSKLLKIGSNLGDAIFSGEPDLKGTIPIQFSSPLLSPTEPREYVIYNETDRDEFDNLKVGVIKDGGIQKIRLIDKDSEEEYKGEAPYIIVYLNGRLRPDLASFAPTLATASLLKKFYGSDDKTGEYTEILQDAMQLYNDSKYRLKADKIKTDMQRFDKESPEYKKFKSLYEAYAANIQTDNFKLPKLA
ncbi:hypothetical protein OQX61_23985 [Pedobacter sp. PLR]|uniref:hypothetical protein n=1 Tax=Pedobacter sp. PLR TaxID=2994465 RepID=UPI002248132E|nr:hypothetical protein [Pedobacter sp. PLR]MCX2454352.1 hypothetical protein [Pedobacter sp. PLR]